MFIPKSLDRSVTDAARSLFADAWLVKPDDCPIPDASTPNGTSMKPPPTVSLPLRNFLLFSISELIKSSRPPTLRRLQKVLHKFRAFRRTRTFETPQPHNFHETRFHATSDRRRLAPQVRHPTGGTRRRDRKRANHGYPRHQGQYDHCSAWQEAY